MTTPADLTDYQVTVPLVCKTADGKHRRTFTLRIPATDETSAQSAGILIGEAINRATLYQYKLGMTGQPGDEQRRIEVTATPINGSIHTPAHDKWAAALAPGVYLTIDAAGCFVIRFPGGSSTITDMSKALATISAARGVRDDIEATESDR